MRGLWQDSKACAQGTTLLVALDSCYSGVWAQEAARDKAFLVQAACAANQITHDGGAAHGGRFTRTWAALNTGRCSHAKGLQTMHPVVPTFSGLTPSSRVAVAPHMTTLATVIERLPAPPSVPVPADLRVCLTLDRVTGAAAQTPLGAPKGIAYSRSHWWPNGSTLRVYFLGPGDDRSYPPASQDLQRFVLESAQEWSRHANIRFAQTHSRGDADIIVSFAPGGSSSEVGNNSKGCCPSMQLGWAIEYYPGRASSLRGTILHEFGHALGLKHEHQHPAGGIPYDAAKVYAYYSGPPINWTHESIQHNVLEMASATNHVVGAYDRDSIMHYAVDAELLLAGCEGR